MACTVSLRAVIDELDFVEWLEENGVAYTNDADSEPEEERERDA